MPLINIKAGSLTPGQKKELIEKMTKLGSDIMNIPENFFFVTIKEIPDENIGIGGKSIDLIKKEFIQNNKS